MKKLHAFLICSIIGCATSSLWGAEEPNKDMAIEELRKDPLVFFAKGFKRHIIDRCEAYITQDKTLNRLKSEEEALARALDRTVAGLLRNKDLTEDFKMYLQIESILTAKRQAGLLDN